MSDREAHRETRNVQICNGRAYNLPNKLAEFIELLLGHLQSIPEEFRDTAVVEIEADEGSCNFAISYARPETDQEMVTRQHNAQEYKARMEVRELEQLRALAAKHGKTLT